MKFSSPAKLYLLIFLFISSLFLASSADAMSLMDMSRAEKLKVIKPPAGGSLSQTNCSLWRSHENNYPEQDTYLIQMLYMYPADGVDNFTRRANMIQKDAQFVDQLYLSRSRGKSKLAWDTGSECGNTYLDIRSIRTPYTTDWYKTHTKLDAYYSTRDFLNKYLTTDETLQTTQKIYFAYLDQTEYKNSTGPTGATFTTGDDKPGLDNYNLDYDVMGFMSGAGEQNQFVGTNSYSILLRRHVVAHELTHGLGAVVASAPHYGNGEHCYDGWDLMCYNGGQGYVLPAKDLFFKRCRAVPFLLDCGLDDYFNPFQVKPESYLSNHWNIANSPYLLSGSLRQPALENFEEKRP